MDKAFLINLLNNSKQTDVKLECGLTKPQFVKTLIESYLMEQDVSTSPDFMEMEKNNGDDKLYDLRRPTKETEKTAKLTSNEEVTKYKGSKPEEKPAEPKPEDQKPEEPKPVEPKQDEPKGEELKIYSDLGIKRVAFDDAFKNMNDKTYEQISDMFTRDEVNSIIHTPEQNWATLKRKVLLAREKDLTTRVVVHCANEDISDIATDKANESPELGRNEVYGKVRIEYLKAFYKDAGEIIARHTNDERYVGLIPARVETIKGLRLRAKKGRDRIVVLMEHPDWGGDKYLFLMGDKTYNFIFEPSSNALPMGNQPEKKIAPKPTQEPTNQNTEKTDTSNQQSVERDQNDQQESSDTEPNK